MKRYITASTTYLSGSYLLDRDGNLRETILHAPSTTYINRGLLFLSPTDADLLYALGKIDEYQVEVILSYNYDYFLKHEKSGAKSSPMYVSEFMNWAELKYAPDIRTMFMNLMSSDATPEDVSKQFDKLNARWYKWLQDNFVKVSVIGKTVEFRITSEDGYDWNDIIIDDVILSYDWKPGTRFNILKEDESGYRAYFYNSSLDDILENDNIILSSNRIDRKIINGTLVYANVSAGYNQLAEIYRKDAEGWMFGKDSRGSLWIGTASEVYEYASDTPENRVKLNQEWADNSFAREIKYPDRKE